jgi:hypothetical protein
MEKLSLLFYYPLQDHTPALRNEAENPVHLTPEAFSAAQKIAANQGTSVEDVVNDLVIDYERLLVSNTTRGELGGVSGLLQSILADARSLNSA